MYEIRPESIKTFITDRNIRLPRFQRKQTWDEKKNFQLCISIFKEYPMGVCILSIDSTQNKTVRWLLDGRQRKNALTLIFEDPENIYNWAQKFIGFKNWVQPSDIEDLFYEKINDYLETDSNDELERLPVVEAEDTFEEDVQEDGIDEVIRSSYGLDFLLDIIKIIHKKERKGTGFTKPFDFYNSVQRLPYIESDNGSYCLSSRKLKTFIDEYRNYCDDNDLDFENEDSFIQFVSSRCDIQNKTVFKQTIQQKWIQIKERIYIIEKIDNLLTNSKIGIIEVKNLSPSDSQKVFNIINSEGEKLTAVEILSAKPHWNIKLSNPTEAAIGKVQDLYKRIGVPQSDVVHWDLPATLISRLGKNVIFKEFSDSTKTDFEKELTFGFKILAGINEKGVKKEDIESLGRNSTINWGIDIENFIYESQLMIRLIESIDYFKYFKSWKTSILEITTDAIALNYFIVMYLDWCRKGKPIGVDLKARQFQKNCIILLDKLIYEYVNRKWRGSSDSLIANNINMINTEPDLFIPIMRGNWETMLEEIYENLKVGGFDISERLMKPILYHFYCIKNIQGPDTQYDIETDHIIPKALFANSSFERKDILKDSLYNLGLLPKDNNISKSDERLMYIESQWLKDQIAKYEFIEEAQYNEFSNVVNYDKLYKFRKAIFDETFGGKRDNLINN